MRCGRDAGRLWSVSLCGPLVIVDQATGTRATSQPEPEGSPRFPAFVDGPASWGGARWCGFPLDMLTEKDADTRQQLMLYGLFHRIQRVERHVELGVGDAAGAATWLLYYRSRELISVTKISRNDHLRVKTPAAR